MALLRLKIAALKELDEAAWQEIRRRTEIEWELAPPSAIAGRDARNLYVIVVGRR